jgi:hypothetical protein
LTSPGTQLQVFESPPLAVDPTELGVRRLNNTRISNLLAGRMNSLLLRRAPIRVRKPSVGKTEQNPRRRKSNSLLSRRRIIRRNSILTVTHYILYVARRLLTTCSASVTLNSQSLKNQLQRKSTARAFHKFA